MFKYLWMVAAAVVVVAVAASGPVIFGLIVAGVSTAVVIAWSFGEWVDHRADKALAKAKSDRFYSEHRKTDR